MRTEINYLCNSFLDAHVFPYMCVPAEKWFSKFSQNCLSILGRDKASFGIVLVPQGSLGYW